MAVDFIAMMTSGLLSTAEGTGNIYDIEIEDDTITIEAG